MHYIVFLISLMLLLIAARFFTKAAESLGSYLGLPAFVVGVFIVGVGTSLPELISGILSVSKGNSEIVAGNVMGANISNLFLVTGLAVVLYKKNINLGSVYIYIDLHFLLGSFFFFYIISHDGTIDMKEAILGIVIYLIYGFYLISEAKKEDRDQKKVAIKQSFPLKSLAILVLSSVAIYFGAEYTIDSLSTIANTMGVPSSIIALTLLSLGTTLPELAVNISTITSGKPELAVGNVLGSCVFNTLMIPSITSLVGNVSVPEGLLDFSLPFMLAAGVFFYLITQDKKISVWEGMMFVCLYILFMLKVI